MKILVAYYSRSGNTKRVAKDLAERLKADIEEIVDFKDRKGMVGWILAGRDELKKYPTEIKTIKDPGKYDLVIVGTPVWAGGATPAVRTYLTKFKTQLKKVAIFNTSGGDGIEKTQKVLEGILDKKVMASMGWTTTELKNEKVYQEKLEQFIKNLRK